jgi:hypothetical protein
VLLAASIGLTGGSAPLPEYAAPRAHQLGASARSSANVIPYRTLTRGDFQATGPPSEAREHAERMGAETCALVMPTSEIQVAGQPVRDPDGSIRYRGAISGLAFRALMDRSCSWWNDAAKAPPPAYVLEHEQIHFALAELAARGLNARAASLMRGFRFESPHSEALEPGARRYVESAIRDAMQALVERNAAFDSDTSLRYEPGRQAAWRKRVEAELRASQRYAAPSSPGS